MKKIIQNCIPLLLTLMMAGAIVILVFGREKPRVTIDRPEIPAYPMVDSEQNYSLVVKFSFTPSEWYQRYAQVVQRQSRGHPYVQKEWYKAKVQKLHDMRQNQPLVVPYYANNSYECISDGLVVWYSSDLFGLSWTYYPIWNDITIRIAFTDVMPQATMLETIRQWNPQFPSPQDPGTAFKSVTERTIQLRDRTVQALVTENAHFDRVTTYFMYDDMLIAVHGPAAECTDNWFSFLSFVALTQNSDGKYELQQLPGE